MTNTTNDVRQHILTTAQSIIGGKGFSAVGLNEILHASSVPKGSFYHYFGSKEAFGEALLENYFTDYLAALDAVLARSDVSAGERLMAYFEHWLETQATCDPKGKCLAVKLAAEVSDAFRPRLWYCTHHCAPDPCHRGWRSRRLPCLAAGCQRHGDHAVPIVARGELARQDYARPRTS